MAIREEFIEMHYCNDLMELKQLIRDKYDHERSEYPYSGFNPEINLNDIKNHGVVPLIALLKDIDPEIREESASMLGELRDLRSLDALIEALNDTESDVRYAAINSLGELRAIDALIAAIKDKNAGTRYESVYILGNLGDLRAVESLIGALEDKESSVRAVAARSLGNLGDLRAVEALIGALEDKESSVRVESACSLGKIADFRAVDALTAMLEYSGVNDRISAIQALASIGDSRAVIPLINILNSCEHEIEVWGCAAEALGSLNDKMIESVFIEYLRDHKQLLFRKKAALILGDVGGCNAIECLSSILLDKNENLELRSNAAISIKN
jgi:HEAT repeat protein